MPLRFEIDEDMGLVRTTAEGVVTAQDLIDHAKALSARRNRPLAELVDFSDRAEVTVPIEVVREIGTLLRTADENRPGGRLALVARSDVVYGMLRVFQAHRTHESVEIRAYRDREEALRWLLEVP